MADTGGLGAKGVSQHLLAFLENVLPALEPGAKQAQEDDLRL